MISILLVDQALENARSIRRLLSPSPNIFDLNCVSSYHEIVAGFHSRTTDVCLIDSEMETGLRLFAQARSVGYTAPIVLVTPNDAHEVIMAMRQGLSDCLIRDDLNAAGIEHSVCCVVEQARNSSLHDHRERRYLALLDNASGIVYTHDLDGNFTSMNRVGEQLIGYSQSEILEMNVAQLIAPEDRMPLEKLIAQTLDAQAQTSNEVELITKFGDKLMVEVSTHPINRDGKTIEIQGILTTPTGLSGNPRWELGLIEDSQTDKSEANRVATPPPYKITSNFLSREESVRSARSIFTF